MTCKTCAHWRRAVGIIEEGVKHEGYGFCQFFDSIGPLPFWIESVGKFSKSNTHITVLSDGGDCKAYES